MNSQYPTDARFNYFFDTLVQTASWYITVVLQWQHLIVSEIKLVMQERHL